MSILQKGEDKCASLFIHFWCLKMVCQCTLSGGIRIFLWFWSHWKLSVLMTLHCVLWTIFPSNLNLNAQAGCHKGTDFILLCKVCSVYCSNLHPPPRHTPPVVQRCSHSHHFIPHLFYLLHTLLYFALIVTFSLFLALLHGLSVSIGGHGLGKRFE